MDQANPQPDIKRIFGNIIIIFAALTLPGVAWSLFGWMHLFLPLLVFLYLTRYGMNIGNRFILAGTGLALIAGTLTQAIDLLLFSLSLIPAGYILARSGLNSESPALSGCKAVFVQILSWVLLIAGYGFISGESPYGSLLVSLQAVIDEAVTHYRQGSNLDPDAMVMLEATLYQVKNVIPIILPALFASCAMFSTWLTMVLGNRLTLRFFHHRVWPAYRYWQLPDRLIWLGIGCAVLAFGPADVGSMIAVNILLLLAVIYCFQGLAICVFFMNKWNVPLLLRSFIYVMIVFQSFGTFVLLVAGVLDTWFDFRKLIPPKSDSDSGSTDE